MTLDLGKVALLALTLALVVFFSAPERARAQGYAEAVNATLNDNATASNELLSIDFGGNNGTAGWAFTSSQNLTITSLGGLLLGDLSGASFPIDVGLWSSTGTLLGSAVITRSSQLINGSLYEAISPIMITAGDTYIVAAGTSGSLELAQVAVDTLQSPFTFAGSAGVSGQGFSFPTTVLPVTSDNSIIYGANFLFQPVPEPGVLGLLALGGLGLVWRRPRLGKK